MSDFVSRVASYPVVEDTCKAAGDAYQWVKGKESIASMLSRIEQAASTLASIVQPVIQSNIAHTLDDVACRQVLDRFEALCPTLKEKSSEELLGPVTNRALNLAETCADYCLPADQSQVHINGTEASRVERLARLQNRASNQALCVFHSSVGRAHELLSGIFDSGSQISHVLATPSVAATLTQVVSILGFACKTAKAVSVPLILQGLTTVRDQTEKLNGQLKESGRLNWIDLDNVLKALNTLSAFISEQTTGETQPEIELLTLSEPAGSVEDSSPPAESAEKSVADTLQQL